MIKYFQLGFIIFLVLLNIISTFIFSEKINDYIFKNLVSCSIHSPILGVKIIVNGDPSQIDLPNKSMSGLDKSKKLLSHLNEISIIDFDHSDVVRHPLVSKIVRAYSNHND